MASSAYACPACGQANKESSRFCRDCGSTLIASPSVQTQTAREPNQSNASRYPSGHQPVPLKKAPQDEKRSAVRPGQPFRATGRTDGPRSGSSPAPRWPLWASPFWRGGCSAGLRSCSRRMRRTSQRRSRPRPRFRPRTKRLLTGSPAARIVTGRIAGRGSGPGRSQSGHPGQRARAGQWADGDQCARAEQHGPGGGGRGPLQAINAHDYARAEARRQGGESVRPGPRRRFSRHGETDRHIISVEGGQVTAQLEADQTDGTVKDFSGVHTIAGGIIIHVRRNKRLKFGDGGP